MINNENPKVTIVIPVYNGAKYIKYAIESALAQTYDNLEILVVDDGSTDNTKKIVKPYTDRVRYIKKKNGGVSSALNLAIEEMKGEYFSWLSHDDTYEPEKVEREIKFLKNNNAIGKKVIVFSDYFLIDKKGKIISESKKDHDEILAKPEYSLLKGHINGLSLLIPRVAFEECGGFDEKMVCVQDYDMWYRMFKKYKFLHVPETLVSTRWHKEQTTQTNPLVETEGNEFFIKIIEDVSKKRRKELEGSEYDFYRVLEEFHHGGIYEKTSEYCKKKADAILEKATEQAKNTKVSVVIPFFNRSKQVVEAVKSVLAQTNQNFEIILVDDCSTEKYPDLNKLIKGKKNIKLIKQKRNSGAGAARNAGLRAAKGDYVAFLDSDDQFLPEKLEKQLPHMIATEARISHTAYVRKMDGEEKIMRIGEMSGQCAEEMMHMCTIATPTVIIDNRYIKKNKILFNENINSGEDTCFWLDLMKNDGYLAGLDEELTIVNARKKSSAYDLDEQLAGLKNICRYLLNDEYYSSLEVGLGKMMGVIAGLIEEKHKKVVVEPKIKGNAIQKLRYFAKHEGVKVAAKRVRNKIARRK